MEQLLEAQAVIPTLKGIKYSAQDLSQFSRCLTHSGGKMQLFYGCDEVHLCVHMYLCLSAVTIATVGSISYGRRCSYWQVGVLHHHGYYIYVNSTYNYAGKLYNRLITALNKGDLTTAQLEQVLLYYGDVFISGVAIETSTINGVHYIEAWTW